jgi:elongation factor Ts
VLARLSSDAGTLVAVGCETEPVSKNDEFRTFAEKVLDTVEDKGPDAVAELEQERQELVGKLGENIQIRGVTRFQKQGDDEVLSAYVHPPANKIGVLVRARGPEDVARLLAMHISFAAPLYSHRGEIPEEDLATERSILEKLPDVQSKPEEIRPKIVDGMLAKRFFGQTVLPDQDWIHDTGQTVEKALAGHQLEVLEYERYALAG